MLELHAFTTPNSLKPLIALEEMGLDYDLVAVDLRKGDQRRDEFRRMNPNGKVPLLIDRRPGETADLVLSESAAILVYLAEQTGKLIPNDPHHRAKVFEQLFFHASGVSPAFLQAFLVGLQKEPAPEAKEKALKEVERVLTVLDHRLADRPYVAGEAYSIADIAHFGWLWRHQAIGATLDGVPDVARWYAATLERAGVQSAIQKMATLAA